MKRFRWISRAAFFGGFLTYMGASFGGLDLIASLEKALLASVVLYGLGVFSLLAYYQVTIQMKKPAPQKPTSDEQLAPPGHGMEGASWDREQAASGKSLQQ